MYVAWSKSTDCLADVEWKAARLIEELTAPNESREAIAPDRVRPDVAHKNGRQ
jgi:hypothetical protein